MKGMGPITPVDPIQEIQPLETGAPNVQGPRVQGQDEPKLGGRQPSSFNLPALKPVQAPKLQPLKPLRLDAHPSVPAPPAADAFSSAFDAPPVQESKSVGGFLKNLSDDVHGFVAGIPAAFRVAWQAGSDIVKNADWLPTLADHPELVTKELSNVWSHVVKGVADTYKDGFGEAVYKHPFSVAMDATLLADVVGAGVKAAGRAALRAGAVDAADTIRLLGESIQKFPGRAMAAPFKAAGNLAMKVPQVRTIAQSLALTPLGMDAKNLFGTYMLEGRAAAEARGKDFLKYGLKKREFEEFNRIIDGDLPIEAATSPKIKARAEVWQKHVMEDERWMTEFGFKTPEELEAGALKPLAMRMKEDGRFQGELYRVTEKGPVFTKEALDAAREYANGANPFGRPTRPTYHPFFHERSLDLADLLEASKSEAQTLNYVKRFEKKTGLGPGLINDPDVYMARSTIQIEQLKAMVRYILEAEQKWGKLHTGAIAPDGYTFLSPILKRYLDHGLPTASESLVRNVTDALRKGKGIEEALPESLKAAEEELTRIGAPSTAFKEAQNVRNWQTVIPKEVAYIIESNLKGVSGPLRFYDKLLNTWRSTVLTLMPRYYVNNLLGNSVLLMFGGVHPFTKSMARNERILPGEVLNSSGMLAIEGGRASSFLQAIPGTKGIWKLADYLSEATDIRPRQIMLMKEAAEIVKRDAALGDSVSKALLAGRQVEDAVKDILAARRELHDIGSKEFMASRKAISEAEKVRQGKLETYEADLGMIRGKLQEAEKAGQREKAIDLQLRKTQDQIKRERDITNFFEGESSADRIKGLKELLSQLEQERSSLTRKSLLDMIGEGDIDLQQLENLRARREYLAPLAAKVDRAVEATERFLGNYGRLHPLERDWVRRVIPFWTFMKTQFKLVGQMPFLFPKRTFLWNQFSKLMLDATNDDRLPTRFQGMIPIGGTPEGQVIFMKISGFNPWEGVKFEDWGGVKTPGLFDPTQNLFVKVLLETRGSYDTFTEQPFVGPTDFVSITGAVYRYDAPKNEVERVIPQKPLLKALKNQIPHMRIIEEALDAFTPTRDVAGITRQDPEGKYIYDRQWWYSVSRAMGFGIHTADPERVKLQHELLVRGMIKRFRSAAKRVDPATRAQIEAILNDLGNGGWTVNE